MTTVFSTIKRTAIYGALSLLLSPCFLLLLPLPTSAQVGEERALRVLIKETGYEPSEITIYQNDTIVFVNEDDVPHWPASNIHPSHTLYPGSDIRKCDTDESRSIFDACRGIGPGESYSFTFTEPGTWRYHDHLSPNLGGDIVVVGNDVTSEADVEENRGFLDRLSETVRVLFAKAKYALFPSLLTKDLEATDMKKITSSDTELRFWMRVIGYDTVLDEVEKDSYLGKLDGVPIIQCHTPAHFVGRMAYELFGTQAFMGEIDLRCNFGFYHGTLEKSLGEHGADPVGFLSGVCKESKDPVVRIFCKHGMGHGLLVFNNYDLPTTLEQCQSLEDYPARQLCYHGTFMENAFASPQIAQGVAHNTPWVDAKDPGFPCNYLNARLRNEGITEQCYFGQSLLWGVPFSSFNVDKVIDRCKEAPEEARLMCFAGLGFSAGAPEAFFSNQKLIDSCDKTPTRQTRDHCLAGVLFMRSTVWLAKQKFDESVFCPLVNKREGTECNEYYDSLLPWASPRNN